MELPVTYTTALEVLGEIYIFHYFFQPPQDEMVTYAGSVANFNPETPSQKNGTHVSGEKGSDENGIKSRIIIVSTICQNYLLKKQSRCGSKQASKLQNLKT